MRNQIQLTEEEYLEGVESNQGICPDCGEISDDFYEPDRQDGTCEKCGKHNVCGFEWALISCYIDIAE